MKITYTLHAQEKLKRIDIKKFKVTKKLIVSIILNLQVKPETRWGDQSAISSLDSTHDLRIIYGIITSGIKIITFHISKKGRYR